jgi:hypothetical protein
MTQSTPSPQLNMTLSPDHVTASWIIPSTNFVLQQSADLNVWTDVTNSPSLNFTNLQNEAIIPLSGTNNFYRLATP